MSLNISLVATFTGKGGPCLSSAVYNGRYYLGNYGGWMFSGPQFMPLYNFGIESVFDMAVFNSQLWITTEGSGLFTLINEEPVQYQEYTSAFFFAFLGTDLFYTAGDPASAMFLYRIQANGNPARVLQVFPDNWLWLGDDPLDGRVIFLIAAYGGAYDWHDSLVMMSTDGTNFRHVVEMDGVNPVASVGYFNGNWYFGTMAPRDDWAAANTANIYKCDLQGNRTLVCETGMNYLVKFFQYKGKLYALAKAGFNYGAYDQQCPPNTLLMETEDGDNWNVAYTFEGDPEVSTAVVSPDGLGVVLGGGYFNSDPDQMVCNIYVLDTIPNTTPLPPQPGPSPVPGNTGGDCTSPGTAVHLYCPNAIFTPDLVGNFIYIQQNPTYNVFPWSVQQQYHAGNTIIWGQNYYVALNDAISGNVPPTVTEGVQYDGQSGVKWQFLTSGFGSVRVMEYVDANNLNCRVWTRLPTTNDIYTCDPTYLWAFPAWVGGQGYPSCTAYFQDRQLFGNTPGQPMTVWMSRTGGFLDFGVDNPVLDDNAITIQLLPDRIGQIPAIRHFLELTSLLILTSGGIWSIQGGSSGPNVITPANVNLSNQGSNIVSHVPPLKIDNYALYIQEKGNQVRTLGFSFVQNSFVGEDLTTMSSHLLQFNKIVDWAYQETPSAIVWMIREDGALLSLTYLPEQKITAWARHDTQGFYESICCIPETDPMTGVLSDSIYFVVRRVLNGESVRCIERLAGRRFQDQVDAYFLDCGLSYDGVPATSFSGLDHLKGMTVSILADGIVYPDQVVPSNGTITLDHAASVVHIGLPYVSDFETLDVASFQQDLRDKRKVVNAVSLIVDKSSGFEVGPDSDNLVPYKTRTTENYGAPDNLLSELIDLNIPCDFNKKGRIFVRQSKPLPLTILAAIPQVEVAGY